MPPAACPADDRPGPPPVTSEPGDGFLNACFLGAHAENNDLFEALLVDALRDHMYWRRNFHPEDPPPIAPLAQQDPEYGAFVARLRRELQLLTARLKRSPPLASPRYMGHMVSDPLLPALLAQMVTTPYNPNNISGDAAPGTIDLELDVGLQLARMFGFPDNEKAPDCAFGHLTSGGTVANYEALRLAVAVKYLPLALREGARATGLDVVLRGRPLVAHDTWSLVNLTPAETLDLLGDCRRGLAEPAVRKAFAEATTAARIETLGWIEFHRRHPELRPPLLLAGRTAHYSWRKAAKLLGLGSASLNLLPTTEMRIDVPALDEALAAAARDQVPVLAVVAILGTTEYGSLDPLPDILRLRDAWTPRGLTFTVHVDAAWGGYLTTLFRAPDGGLRPREDMRREFRYFPSPRVYATFAALARADTVTVDPHKLGYLPYGAGGGFVCRDQRLMALVNEDAPYVFDPASGEETGGYRERFRDLGRFILEGSKPGAAAAGVYVTHRVLPLDAAHFGRLARRSLLATERLYDGLRDLAARLRGRVHLLVPFEPDANVVCVAFNPAGNTSVGALNAYFERVYARLRVRLDRPLQAGEFFGSSTLLRPETLGREERRRILADLGLAGDGARTAEIPDVGLRVLRHALMNPWLMDDVNGIDYIDLYCRYLETLLVEELPRNGAGGPEDSGGRTSPA